MAFWHERKDPLIDLLKLIHDQLNRMGDLLIELTKEQKQMQAGLSALQAQVQATTNIEASAVTLIRGIAAQLEDAKQDPAAIQEIVETLKSSATALGAAVTANTSEQIQT